LGVSVAEASPKVHYLATVAVYRDSGADLVTTAQVAAECVRDFAVAFVGVTADEIRRYVDFPGHACSVADAAEH
jgi:hypothetical protein